MQLRMFADLAAEGRWADERIDAADADRQPPRPRIRSLYRPLGPTVVFGASNFPLAFSVAGGDTAAALAAGCTVIVKGHSGHPETSRMTARAVETAVARCGLPAAIFLHLDDANGHELGAELVKHPLVKAGAFTGSQRGGLALQRVAQSRPEPIPFFAEMGSVNPVFLLSSALAARGEEITNGLHASMTLGVGQFCTQPGLVFLLDDDTGRSFVRQLSSSVGQTPSGNMLTRGIRDSYRQSVLAREAVPGVRVCARVMPADGDAVGASLFGTDVETFLSSPALHEEVFGPSTLIVKCQTEGDYLRCAEHLGGQLTATIWAQTDDLSRNRDLLWTLEQKAGRILFNGFPTGVEVGPAMMHGGPHPASTDGRFTSVGTRSVYRFVRPVAFQNELE